MINYDYVIQGTGFRSIFASLYLAHFGHKVCIVDKNNGIYNFLKPFTWKGYILDKGPQYFDDFRKADWELLETLLDGEYFHDIEFSYGSFANGNLSGDFAIPVWEHFHDIDSEAAFEDLKATRNNFPIEFNNFDEYLKSDGGETLYPYLAKFSEKFLVKKSTELSSLTKNLVTFCGRKSLFGSEKSMELKKDEYYDSFLAAKKIDADSDRYNLYPKSTNNEDIRIALEKSLKRYGVDLYLEKEIYNIDKSAKQIIFDGMNKIGYHNIVLADNIQNSENYFYKSNEIRESIYNLPEIFFIFEIEKKSFIEKNYIVNYDPNHISTRITNFSNYSNTSMKNDVICVEVPTSLNSELWLRPESFLNIVAKEVNEVNGNKVKILDSKCFKIPSTYKLPLISYDKKVSKFIDKVKNDDSFIVPNHLYLTRKNSIDTIKEVLPL